MADDFQQRPIQGTAPLLQVNAADPDAGSRGDGFVRDLPARKPNKKSAARHAPPPPESPPAEINPSVLLQDEVNLTRSARTIMGEPPPPPAASAEPPPEDPPPNQPTATRQHIHLTA
ncbi:MAG: hypothetical protein WCR06_05580 [bacterium]